MKERDIEAYLVKRVRELGGEVRKVKWVGRRGAPDRVVMLPPGHCDETECPWSDSTIWVELKNPETIQTFPKDFRERAQHREHERMRKAGQRVEVVGTIEGVDEVLR